MANKSLLFPPGFIWGAATASYQIEGGFDEDGKGESIWDRFSHTPDKIRDGDTGDTACDHYHRFAEDINIMAEIGLKAYRFSISWPRIIPAGTGQINEKGLDFYEKLVDKLLEKEIIPFITLYHWDLPQALEDRGGWRNKDTSYAFGEYVNTLVERLSDRVTNWMTLNEMPCIAGLGYKSGIHAPGAQESPKVLNQVIHNLLLAHGLAVRAVKSGAKVKPEVGLVHNPVVTIPQTSSQEDLIAARTAWGELDAGSNAWWLDPVFKGEYPQRQWQTAGNDVPEITDEEMKIISTPTDFLGLNIYTGFIVKADDSSGAKGFKEVPYPENHPTTGIGFYTNPDCIYYGLKLINERYKIPKFYIAENGCAFDDKISEDGQVDDDNRVDYLRAHFASAHRAVAEDINLAGYFIWSLMDNFEWAQGFSKRLGIVFTDYADMQKRIMKKSACWYKNLIKTNEIEI
jgi:beta-glucosidase